MFGTGGQVANRKSGREGLTIVPCEHNLWRAVTCYVHDNSVLED